MVKTIIMSFTTLKELVYAQAFNNKINITVIYKIYRF